MTTNSSRYRILWLKSWEPSHKNVTHWIFSMNGQDFMVYYKDGTSGRGFSLHQEFPPQWKYVNDRLDVNTNNQNSIDKQNQPWNLKTINGRK